MPNEKDVIMPDEKLAACLAAVNQVFGSNVNPDQSFFDLGGDSVHAIELVLRIQQLTGVEVNAFEMVNGESLLDFLRRSLDPA